MSLLMLLENKIIKLHRNWNMIREEKEFIMKFKRFLNKIHILEKNVLL